MYISFNKRHEYFRDFFIKYADRIQFGTDGVCPSHMPSMEWLVDRIYRFLATDELTDAWGDTPLKGLNLPYDAVCKILSKNFIRTVSDEPKEINKIALKAYIEKYKHLIADPNIIEAVEKLSKELL